MAETSELMLIGNGIQMSRRQYLAGFKEDKVAARPTIPQLAVKAAHTIDGTIDDVFKKYPELEPCLYNEVKVCTKCGKPCAYTMTVCNSCGADLPTDLSKSENVFSAFLFGVKLASRGFPYTISLRGETEDVLVFDDMLQLCSCHLNAIPKTHYIPDWRYLLMAPAEANKILDSIETAALEATKVFLGDAAYREVMYKTGVTDEYIINNIVKCFNFPPSQFQLHMQWLVPPLTPFHMLMALEHNHFHKGRGFPVSYVRKVLAVGAYPEPINKETSIESIMEYYKGKGVDYEKEWTEWYDSICISGSEQTQNWKTDDFEYVVEGGKAFRFTVEDGKVALGEQVDGIDPTKLQVSDKAILQNYGRPYTEAGKPTGTYIQKPLEPKFGSGGFGQWPPASL